MADREVDYATQAPGYAERRRTDPRIAAQVHAALGSARTLVNVGAGTGSYEPTDCEVTAVEPSAAMRAQRTSPAVDAVAESLPFADTSFDAALATMTVHQWRDLAAGLRELRRVTSGPVVVLTSDPDHVEDFWLSTYVPELLANERRRFPTLATIDAALGGACRIEPVDIPIDCVDGFIEAYYARPEAFLEPGVRSAQSAWTFVAPDMIERGLARLRADLDTGAWDERYRALRAAPTYAGSLRLVIAQ